MSDTRTKLKEAKFFLNQMEENLAKNPDFTYCFSAFIGAARSVLWIMQYEFQEVPGWREWYDSQAVGGEDAEFLKAVNAIRVRSQKQTPLLTDTATVVVADRSTFSQRLNDFLDGLDGHQVRMTFEVVENDLDHETRIEDNKVSFIAKGYKIFRTIDDFPGQDVLVVSGRYISWLDGLVEACERLFLKSLNKTNSASRIRLTWLDPEKKIRRGRSEA